MKHNMPSSFFHLSEIPNLQIHALYATEKNFMQKKLPGYATTKELWIHVNAKPSLIMIAQKLQKEGLGLWVWDAYRPKRATDAMVQWARYTGQYSLVADGYIAIRSRHNGGGAIDCSLYELNTLQLLDMGTEWDTFDIQSHIQNATGQAATNRKKLHDCMNGVGWKSYEKEWWHFELPQAGQFESQDIPYDTSL